MQNKSKILFLYSSNDFGGLITNLSYIVNNISQEKFEVTVVCIENKKEQFAIENKNIKTIYLNSEKKFDFSVINSVLQEIKKGRINVLSCHGYKANFYGVFIKIVSRIKSLTMVHGWVGQSLRLKFYHTLDKILVLLFNKIILVTPAEFEKSPYLKHFRNKINVIPNGIDVEKYKSITCKQGVQLENYSGKLIIGVSSRLSKEKNIETLLYALQDLKDSNVYCLILGDGPERETLEELAIDLDLLEDVSFIGFQPNVQSILKLFDIYVTCSLREGLPNSLLEAAALSRPIIASNIPEHKVVIDQHCGVLFEKENYKDLSKKLEKLIADSDLRKKLGMNCYNKVEKDFSLKTRIEKLEQAYKELTC